MRALTPAVILTFATLTFAAQARAQSAGDPVVEGAAPTEEAAPADEEDPAVAEARALFDRGRQLADQRRFSEAAEAFDRSLALVERPSTAFNLALCHYALGRHVEAIDVLERYRSEADPVEEGPAYEEAAQMLAHARRSVGTLVVEVSPPDARVSVDGRTIEGGATRTARVNPGPHVVRARAPHHRELLLEVEVDRGETVRRAAQLTDGRTPARLSIRVPDLPEAEIAIDGEVAGRGAAELELDAGRHALRVTHPTIRPHEQTLELDWSEHASVVIADSDARASLAEEPALWIGVGAAALAIGGAIAIGFAATAPRPFSGGSTGVVLRPEAPLVRFSP